MSCGLEIRHKPWHITNYGVLEAVKKGFIQILNEIYISLFLGLNCEEQYSHKKENSLSFLVAPFICNMIQNSRPYGRLNCHFRPEMA